MSIRVPLVVWLFTDRTLKADHSRLVSRYFERNPGPIEIRAGMRSVELTPDMDHAFSWDNAFECLNKIRAQYEIPPDHIVYLLTALPNEYNWYSFEDPNFPCNAVGHVGDYSWVTRAPAEVISAHYVLKTIFSVILGKADLNWEDYMHETMRGCISDFCSEKSQLDFKLRTGDICGDCMDVLAKIGVPDELLKQAIAVMESMRKSTVSTGPYLSSQDDYNRWPFPVAVTRHKASQAINATNRLKLLLDHLDSLVRYICFAYGAHTGETPNIGARPSLGTLVEAVRNLPDGEYRIPSRLGRIVNQNNLVHIRNETLGHGHGPPDEQTYGPSIQRLQAGLQELEQVADAFLSAYQLIIPGPISMAGGVYNLEGRQLIGSHLLHPQFRKALSDSPDRLGIRENTHVYLCNTSMTSFKSLSPYIRFDTCTECRHQRVLLSDGGNIYLDVFGGHRIQLSA
jgi:hypothetical protein